jgi:hypothetical protein
MSNPTISAITSLDQILLGADEFYAASGVAEQRYFHQNIFEPVLGVIQNVGDTPITVSVQHSNDDGATDAYTALTMRVRGSNVTSITVQPRSVGLFVLEGFLVRGSIKKWLKASASARAVNGRLSFIAFTGTFSRVGAHIA